MAAESNGGETYYAFPPFDQVDTFASQVFWFAIAFLILYVVSSRVILPKIGDTLKRRTGQIEGDLNEAARLNDEAVSAKKALEKRLAEARANARALADKARAEMDAEIAAETASKERELDEKLSEAEARIQSVRAEALASVGDISEGIAGALVKQLGGSASAADVKAAVKAVGG